MLGAGIGDLCHIGTLSRTPAHLSLPSPLMPEAKITAGRNFPTISAEKALAAALWRPGKATKFN